MNKQEAIEKIEQEKYDFSKPWTSLDRSDYKDGYNDASDISIEFIEQLDEPQKVKVPSFIGRWIEEVKQRGCGLADALNCFASPIMTEDVKEWLDFNFSAIGCHHDHQELLARAWLDGYEVEEEPKWVVNDGDLVIHRGEHEAKVYFVESVDEDGILLVNGIKDEFFTDMPERAVGDESVSYFYKNFRLLARKENLEVEKV